MKQNATGSQSKSPQYHILSDTEDIYAITYSKSNRIINSKGRSTALGLKLFAIGISNVQVDNDGQLYSIIRGTELRRVLGSKSGALYQQIKNVIKPRDTVTPSILDWRIFIQDDDTQRIAGVNIITDALFENGQLRLSYNNKIKDDIYNLRTNYTILSLVEMAKLKSPYSIRMYEIFKSEMDYQRARAKGKDTGIYYVTYEIDELKRVLGIIDPADEGDSKTKADRKKNASAAKKDIYPVYNDFKRRVLEKIKEELNDNTEVHVDFEQLTGGIGGKVQEIRFKLMRQDLASGDDVVEISHESIEEVINKAYDLMGEDLSKKDIRVICEEANYDLEKIQRVYGLSTRQMHINNLTGWLIEAIRNNYEEPVEKKSKPKRQAGTGKKNAFNDFEQHDDYDFDEIEKAIIGN